MDRPDPKAFGSIVAELLTDERTAELGPGKPKEAVRSRLTSLLPDCIFPGKRIVDPGMVQACISGLWLYHDFLEESHHISQDLSSPAGSYWHGIMHRREPDFGNSKYWFRRVGDYPTFDRLRQVAASLATSSTDPKARFLVEQTHWDPYAFIDLCQAVIGRGDETERLCRQIQHQEWWLLFDDCYRQALET